MKSCKTYQKRLWLDAYGELEPEERGGVERHLSICPECRRERDTLLDLIDQVPKIHPTPALTAGEAARLTNNILRDLEGGKVGFFERGLMFFGLALRWNRAAVVCLMIVVIGGVWAWRSVPLPFQTTAGPSMEERVLVEDLEVIRNLELLEEFDDLEKLVQMTAAPEYGNVGPSHHPTMGDGGGSNETRRRHVA